MVILVSEKNRSEVFYLYPVQGDLRFTDSVSANQDTGRMGKLVQNAAIHSAAVYHRLCPCLRYASPCGISGKEGNPEEFFHYRHMGMRAGFSDRDACYADAGSV